MPVDKGVKCVEVVNIYDALLYRAIVDSTSRWHFKKGEEYKICIAIYSELENLKTQKQILKSKHSLQQLGFTTGWLKSDTFTYY